MNQHEQFKPNGNWRAREVPTPTYVYRWADGTPHLGVHRIALGDGKSHWTGRGWAWGKPPEPKVPYRLPEMLAAVHDTVIIVEGERDADTLAEHGFIATTTSKPIFSIKE
jgi:hypothetical protein